MKTEFLQVPEAYYNHVFKRLWRYALVIAVVFGGCVFRWPEYTTPFLVIPFIGALLAGVVMGWTGGGGPAEEATREFASNFWLRLSSTEAGTEVDYFESMVPDAKDRRKIHRLISNNGEVFVINAARFKELLVSRTLDDAGKASEHALGVAWHRCCGELRPDLAPLLSKTFREAFVQDLNGNLVTLLSRVGDKLIEELRAQAEPEPDNEALFELTPLLPTEGPRPKRGNKSK